MAEKGKWVDCGTCWLSKSGKVLVIAIDELVKRYFVVSAHDVEGLLKDSLYRAQIREKVE